MAAADRAMYQAKSLGKNQISGNPRPRPALLARRSTLEPPPAASSAAMAVPVAEPAVAEPPAAASQPDEVAAPRVRSDDRVVAVPLGPVVGPEAPAVPREAETDDAEPDPAEVRERIVTASRSFDSDHQVRRAMDAFFSPTIPPSIPPAVPSTPDRERPGPEH